ncbi:MAG: hypothetical protein LIP01_01610, partial [Tannerellaceae bacterium]|nr:hypothetical protein [Tannerellaceae bacterium]
TALIKGDLHQLLEDMMELLKETKDISRREYEFYVTHFNIALTAYYIVSDNCYLSGLRTPFLNSCVHDDYNTGYKIRKWIHSLKKSLFFNLRQWRKGKAFIF